LKKYLLKALKIFLWIIGCLLGLFLLIVIALQIPAVQNFAKNKAVTFLEDKIKTKVEIGRIEIGLPKKIILEDVYFEDQNKDTLLSGEKLAVNISLFKLLDNQLEINSVDLKGITANISKNKDSVFNFNYIIDAFVDKNAPKTDSPPMVISVNEINLDNITFRYDDAISKNDVYAYINHFDTKFENFDLDKMEFNIPEIQLIGLKLKLKQGIAEAVAKATEKVAEETQGKLPNIKLGKIKITKFDVSYLSKSTKLDTKITFDSFQTLIQKMDLQKQDIAISYVALSNLKGKLEIGKTEKTSTKIDSTSTPTSNKWKVAVNKIDVEKVNFQFDNANSVAISKGIDYMHLKLSDVNLNASSIIYDGAIAKGTISKFNLKDKSGVQIDQFTSDFYYSDSQSYLKNLYLKTPQTDFKDQIGAQYQSIASIEKNLGELEINASVKNSTLGFKDILYFVPNLAQTNPFKSNPNAILNINTTISGKIKDLKIPNLEVSGIGSTKASVSGTIKGMPNVETAYFDLNIKQFKTTAKDIKDFVPNGTIPSNITLPNSLFAVGNFKGAINNFATKMNVKSTMGNAKIDATFDQRRKNQEKYIADATLDNFNVGKLIQNNQIGILSVRAKVSGQGLDPKTANAKVIGKVLKADFNKYRYTNINLDGAIANGKFNAKINANDPNLTFDLVSNGGFNGKYPNAKLNLKIDIADLRKLNLHAGALKLKGDVNADFESIDVDNLNGKLTASNFLIALEKEQFPLDSLTIIAVNNAQTNSIKLRSQFANIAVDGKYKLSKIGDALTNSISKYYDLGQKTKATKSEPQQVTLVIDVKDSPILQKIVPEITTLSPIKLEARYNSINDTIVVNGTIPKLVYAGNTVTNAVIKVNKVNDSLVYSLFVDDVKNPSFELPFAKVSGAVSNNLVSYLLELKDVKNVDKYTIAGTFENKNGESEIKLDPTNLLLNYEKWDLAEENIIQLRKKGIYIDNFNLSKGSNILNIQSESTTANAPLNVELKDFEIKTLTNFVQSDFEFGGKINGVSKINNLNTSPNFTADLDIQTFTVKKDTVGNIAIKVNNRVANTFDANVAITGNGNQVNLDGTYKTGNGQLNFVLDVVKLQMASIQAFTFGAVTQSTGFLNGKLDIQGTAVKPNLNGKLKFNNVATNVVALNSKFQLINDSVLFETDKITFNTFKFKDENENDLVIDGIVKTDNLTNLGFDLTVKADNFRAVNSTSKDNDLYYGELYLDNNLKITGDVESPNVQGTVKINKDTKFSIVLPQSDPSIADREGIVEFIDQDQPILIETVNANEEFNQSELKGMNVSVNIEIDKEAELSIIIDKANGDFLKLKGEARLTGGIDPSGKTNLTGRYEFTEGSYEMSFNFIKRKFDIKPGSYILWTGEPTSADVNITAIYTSETAPIDLVDDQLGSVSAEVRNTYKQKIPFNTELKMKGELLEPVISFDIVLPDGNNDVSTEIINTTQTKLEQIRQQPELLNKQVFALLLLNRFIGENPFASEAGGTSAATIARQSASKILSQQLNNLAGDLIAGVELNFDLESTEDYSTGNKENRTDLNVGLSKQLLNDRLKVTVGSNIGLEGAQRENESASNIAGDVSADYLLTKDGRYKIRAYRKNRYQVALQGQVVETGVGFIITMDYNKFSELFKKSKQQKQMEKEAADAEKKDKKKEKQKDNENKKEEN
jgi:hypothetical protein